MEDHVNDASNEASPSSNNEDESRELMVVDSERNNDIQAVDDASVTEKWRERKRRWDDKKTIFTEIARLSHDEFCELLSIDPTYGGENPEEDDEFVTKANELFAALRVTSQHSNHEGLTAEIEELRSQIGNLRTEVRDLEQQVQDDSPRNLNQQASSDDSQRYRELNQQLIRQSIQGKQQLIQATQQLIQGKQQLIQGKQQLIQATQQLIQRNEQLIQAKQQKMIDDFSLYIGKILDAHEKVALQLSIYRTKGNETYPKSGDRSSRQYSENLNRIDPTMEPSPTIADVALRNPQESGDIRDKIVSALGAAIVQDVREFESFFHNLMSKATKEDEVDDTTMALSNTIEAIWKQKIEEDKIYLRPSETKDEETKVEQPIAHAILCKLLGLVSVDPFVTSGQYLSPVESYSGARRVDFLAHSTHEHLTNLSLHHMTSASVEVKASLETKTDQKIAKGENQNVGHMAKRMLASFHLMGVGVNEVLYGITMSLKFVSVVRMELSGVGTLQPKVSCERTERIAIGSSNNAFPVVAGALMLSLKNDTNSVLCSDLGRVPVGGERRKRLGRYLGAGAFSNVYKIDDRVFLKLPKYAKAGRNERREAEILTTLAHAEVPNVPTSPQQLALKLVLRGQVGQCRGLKLEGIIGESAESITFDKKQLLQMMGAVSKAISCAHSCNIVHLDIRPSNIIVVPGTGDNDMNVMVSDWGCAVSTTEFIVFHGCIPFAHDELLQEERSKAKPKKMYDWASFIYTFFFLQTRSLPWSNHITTRNCGMAAIEKRWSAVEEWWWNLPFETRDQFKAQKVESGIGNSKRKGVGRSPRNNKKPRS